MGRGPHLYRRGAVYHWQRRLPSHFASHLKLSIFRLNLGANDVVQARASCAALRSCDGGVHDYAARAAHQMAAQTLRSMRHGLALHFEHDAPLLPAPAKATPALLTVKRVADVMLSIAALLALSPVMLFIATLIKTTSSGPILFAQNREGLNGEMFRMYKFRTLHWAVSDLSGINAVIAGDPRLTPVGALLRRTSIDELPQLINIILGDMSLVGPRPHVPGMLVGEHRYDEVVPYYTLRHRMKPGLTGWAQVNGLRGAVETRQSAKARVDHDLAYIANYSVMLDIRILLWTIWQEFVRPGRGP